jgi:hypothetical protein
MSRPTIGLAVAVVVASSFMNASPATAAIRTRFLDSCSLHGTDFFAPALTLKSGAGTASATALGRCSGVLLTGDVRRSISNANATYTAHATSTNLSCAGGLGSGSGTLSIVGFAFPFQLAEPQLAVVSVLKLTGDHGGNAIGVASVVRASPTQLLMACTSIGIANVSIALAVVSTNLAT